MRPLTLSLALYAASAVSAASAVEIDGRIDAQEWADARHITEFVQVQPLTRMPATHQTQAWVLSTPEGLAVAFRSDQPASVPRVRQKIRRDEQVPVDRVNVMVDFQGDGRTAYDFMVSLSGGITDAVITNERSFNLDWDGDWRSAVSEDEAGWSAEILIPWHVAPMPRAQDGKRTIALYLDRVVAATGERAAWPAATFSLPRFVSDFVRIEIPAYEQSLLAVTPYVSASYDNVRSTSGQSVGADLFWKMNGQFQLSATLNPDFGQVESDDLVVNFSAIETFFSDKRPFFTENQGLFDLPFGTNGGRLLYTRRIGGTADDGRGAGDVRAAAKLNGNLGQTSYGVLAASEADEVGRDFYAARATRELGAHGLGAMALHVERPFIDREASVYAVDHQWKPNERVQLASTLVASNTRQSGVARDDLGFQARLDHQFGDGWRQQAYLLHAGDELQLNDIGFLDRNNFNYLRYELARRFTGLAQESRYASHDWRIAASRRENAHGLRIADAWAISRFSERRDGGHEFFDVARFTPGLDDLILRGNGVVRVPEKLWWFYERFRPRNGRWDWLLQLRGSAEGLDGFDGMGVQVRVQPTFHVSDSFNISAGLRFHHNPDWLLWRGGNRLGSFDARTAALSSTVQWRMSQRQELRVKLETIALDAQLEQAWRVGTDRLAVPSDDPIGDFNLRNLGFQIRYRFELAPLSDLYVVYGRGGLALEEGHRPLDELLGDAFSLRDDEQFLVKLSYRFAN